jgi:hypothetical protein
MDELRTVGGYELNIDMSVAVNDFGPGPWSDTVWGRYILYAVCRDGRWQSCVRPWIDDDTDGPVLAAPLVDLHHQTSEPDPLSALLTLLTGRPA